MSTENSKRFVFQNCDLSIFLSLVLKMILMSRRSLNLAGEISKLRPNYKANTLCTMRHNPLISMIQIIHRPFHQLFRWQMISRDTCCFYRDVSVMYSKFTDENRKRELKLTRILTLPRLSVRKQLSFSGN